jgi:ribosomal protein S8
MTDPIADYLTRLRNAIQAKHRVVEVPASNLKKEITKILFEKGYILNYKFVEDGPQGTIKVALTRLTQSRSWRESLLRVCVNIPVIKTCRVLLMVWVLL